MGTIFIIMLIIVALGWAGHFLWEYKLRQEEKQIPSDQKGGKRVKSERLREAEKTFEDYAKKMAEFKKKPYGGNKPQ